ncbi:MAG: TetR/AcrR family transcriptional regulator [Leptolyngbya sp. BL-A-14]
MPRKILTKPRKLPRQERSKVTVEAILTATARILTEEGYDKANTNRIAEVAGVSVGSLYQYFPNKESLIAALAEHHADEMVQLVESHLKNLSNAPIQAVLHGLVRAAILAHAVNPALHKVLNEQVPRSDRMRQTAEAKMAAILRAYLEKQRDQLQPQNLDLMVFIVGRTVEALTHAAVIEQPELLSSGQLEQEITQLVLSYLVKP